MSRSRKKQPVDLVAPMRVTIDEALSPRMGEMRLKLAAELWGWAPHDGQKKFWLSEPRYKVLNCGRKWGKSMSLGYDVATWLLAFGGCQYIFAPVGDQTDLIFQTVVRMLSGLPHLGARFRVRNKPHRDLYFYDDDGRLIGEIHARSADRMGQSRRGPGAHRVVIDEAAYVGPDIISSVIKPMLTTTNGALSQISTPFGMNHFYDSYRKSEAYPDLWFCMTQTSYDNPYNNHEFLEQLKAEMIGEGGETKFRQEMLAEFQANVANVFPMDTLVWDADRGDAPAGSCLIAEPTLLGPKADREYVCGADIARWSDWTAIAVVDVTEYPFQVVYTNRFKGRGWDDVAGTVAMTAHQWGCKRLKLDATRGSVGDPVMDNIQLMLTTLKSQTQIVPIDYHGGVKQRMVHGLRSKLEQRMISFLFTDALGQPDEMMRTMVNELREYQITKTTGGNEKFEAPKGQNDDFVSALMMAVYTEWPTVKVENKPIGEVGELFRKAMERLTKEGSGYWSHVEVGVA